MKVLELFEDEDHTLLSKLIAGLIAKGVQVQIYAEVWNADPRKRTADMYNITEVYGKVLHFSNDRTSTWVEMIDDVSDSRMSFKKEDGIWTLREGDGGPVLS